jgi:hypothetical protein
MEHAGRRPHLAGSWRPALATVALAGVLGVGPALVAPGASEAVLSLHPNEFAQPGSIQAAVGWSSTNWSGYAQTGSTYHAVTGSWTVPSVSATWSATYSAAWIGIDGYSNSSLIQTGTEQDYYRGAAHYAAWWTTSAQGFAEQAINEPVAAGDPMSATITQVAGTSWTITLTDNSAAHGWNFTKPVTYTGPGASAEWILEAPTVGGRQATVAAYQSPMTFDPGTVNGGNPHLLANQGGDLLVRVRRGYQVVSVPSVPDTDTDGFNMFYGSTAGAAPSS